VNGTLLAFLEIPRPHWTAHDAKKLGIGMPKDVPMPTPERPDTFPKGHTPRKQNER
jgi:hypothetical protein